MAGISTIKYYWDYYLKHKQGLAFSKDYQLKLYNWFPPFYPQDLWLSKFIEGRGILRNKPKLRAGLFTICGPEWFVKYYPCDLKIFFARENLAFRPSWRNFMLNDSSIDLSIGFDDIKDNSKYIHVPFWITWALDPLETYDSIKKKIDFWNSPDNKSFTDRKFCSFLCSHGDEGRKKIFDELSAIDKVDSAGKWLHNDDSLKTSFNDDKVSWLKNYRFNLTPENSNAPGYVTEKLLEAIQGGCIPIYWGSDNEPDIDVFNKDAIIFFEMGKENPSVVNLISELNADEKKYMDFSRQRRFVQGAEDTIWHFYEQLGERLECLISGE